MSPVEGQDQPKCMRYAVRDVRTLHGDERQLHLQVQVMCGRKDVVTDVLVDTGAKVSLAPKGFFPDTCLKSNQRPVCFMVANSGIMGVGACEA